MRAVLTLAASAMLLAGAAGAAVYDEGIDGDLSDDFNAPTVFDLDVGSNTLTATTGTSATDFSDYFSIVLGPQEQLDAIVLTVYSPGPNNSSTAFEDCVTGIDCNPLGGEFQFIELTTGLVGTDLLTVFADPLGGDYFRIGEGSGPASITLDFQVSAVPLPAGLPLLLGALGAAGLLRRRKAR